MKTLAIAVVTYKELVRSKSLYLALFSSAFLVIVTSLFGSVTIGEQVLIIKDFGLFSTSLFTVGFVVVAGSSMLHKELQRRTIYNVLSKPVRRLDLIVGKFCGLVSAALMMLLVMGVTLSAYVYLYEERFDLLLWYAYLYIALELLIVSALVIFLSSIVVTPILAGLIAFAIFLVGRNAEYILYFSREKLVLENTALFLNFVYELVPHLQHLYIGNDVVYGGYPNLAEFGVAIFYTAMYSIALLIVATFFFCRRDFN